MKRFLRLFSITLLLAMLLSGCRQQSLLDPGNPVTLTMWHVYGEQADSPMNRLVEEFNSTVGKELGIIINVTKTTSTSKIGAMLLDAQAGNPGADDMPDLFFCHTSSAHALGAENLLDWNQCFSDAELEQFVEGFVLDGTIDGRLTVFPVSKSTYALFINGSVFQRFSQDTGFTYEDLADWDGFFTVAEAYYQWSGGKTFCAMDYLIRHIELDVLAKNGEMYTESGWYNFDSQDLKDAWMPFGLSLAQGHIAISDLYANTQVMTGETAAGIGSTAAILYYNDVVTYPDNSTEPTNLMVLPLPKTAGCEGLMPQTGVGLCAGSLSDQEAEAASVFAHWLTEGQRNLEFVADTGYMPVNDSAFDAIEDYPFESDAYARLYAAMEVMNESYTAVVRPTYDNFYDKIDVLYDGLREMQVSLRERAAQGEDPNVLAEETWAFFSSIQ